MTELSIPATEYRIQRSGTANKMLLKANYEN